MALGEFKGFNYNIPDDVETIFDVCDKSHSNSIKRITYHKNKKEYLKFIKDNHRPIDMIYKDLMIYYKYFEKNQQKFNDLSNKINPFYLAKP